MAGASNDSIQAGGSPDLSRQRIGEIERMLPIQPAGFGVPCSERQEWTPVAANYQAEVRRAQTYLASPLPAWSDDAYLQFSRNGDRRVGEAMLRGRNGQLSTLVLAECAEWKGRFLPRIEEELNAISIERSWTLPAGDAKLENFYQTHYSVDLNASTMGHEAAEALYLLGDKLSPETRRRVLDALDVHVFAPFRRSLAGQRPDWWLKATNNWNAVCLDGVADAALTVLPDRGERAIFAAAAEHYSGYYLESFRDSGYADEGIGYWSYGFSHYAGLREQLWYSTGGKLDLFDAPKAQRAALFGFQFAMLPGVYADFGDAHFMTKPDPVLLASLDHIFGLGMVEDSAHARALALQSDLSTAVLASFPIHSERHVGDSHAPSDLIGLRTYYSDVGVLVDRPQRPEHSIAITIKAGGNSNHSHNDIGSYSIGMDSVQVVGDPGGPLFYTADTFSARRYDSPLLNSFGHPVPSIDGQLQLEATKVKPKVVSTRFTPDEDSIAMDITAAYYVSGLRHLVRTMNYVRKGNGSVEIVDTFTLKRPAVVVESFPTHGSCRQLDARTLQFDDEDAHLLVVIDGPGSFTVTQDRILDYGESVNRVGVHFNVPKNGEIRMHFAPAAQ